LALIFAAIFSSRDIPIRIFLFLDLGVRTGGQARWGTGWRSPPTG
jgi:hypothetical protein